MGDAEYAAYGKVAIGAGEIALVVALSAGSTAAVKFVGIVRSQPLVDGGDGILGLDAGGGKREQSESQKAKVLCWHSDLDLETNNRLWVNGRNRALIAN